MFWLGTFLFRVTAWPGPLAHNSSNPFLTFWFHRVWRAYYNLLWLRALIAGITKSCKAFVLCPLSGLGKYSRECLMNCPILCKYALSLNFNIKYLHDQKERSNLLNPTSLWAGKETEAGERNKFVGALLHLWAGVTHLIGVGKNELGASPAWFSSSWVGVFWSALVSWCGLPWISFASAGGVDEAWSGPSTCDVMGRVNPGIRYYTAHHFCGPSHDLQSRLL